MVIDWSVVSSIAAVVVFLSINIAAIGFIPEGKRPQTAMAWLILILFLPYLGIFIYFFLGSPRIGRRRQASLEGANAKIIAGAAQAEADGRIREPDLGAAPDYVESLTDLNRSIALMPLTAGNHVQLLPDYQEAIDSMIQQIDQAKEFINVEFYIMALDEMTIPFFDALDRATARGVTVRLLFDHLGTRRIPGYRELLTRLEASDIQWRMMMPLLPLKGRFRRPDLRNHRKLLVVDDEVGFTGSLNLTHPSYNKPKNIASGRQWVELWMRLEGPVVTTIDALFAADWALENKTDLIQPKFRQVAPYPHNDDDVVEVPAQLIPSGPGYVAETNLRLFTSLIYNAKNRIMLTSPYFVPDETLLYAITTAAQRGVEVNLFVSEQADQFMVGHAQSSYYSELLQAGVRIWLYPKPFILHAKHFTIDEDVCVVGTSNMDMRSFALNYEMSVMFIHRELTRRVVEVAENYQALSRELTLAEWENRRITRRFVDNAMRLTATLQ